jgi:hypothetical protein
MRVVRSKLLQIFSTLATMTQILWELACLRKAGNQAPAMLDVPTSSQAGQLPQRTSRSDYLHGIPFRRNQTGNNLSRQRALNPNLCTGQIDLYLSGGIIALHRLGDSADTVAAGHALNFELLHHVASSVRWKASSTFPSWQGQASGLPAGLVFVTRLGQALRLPM